MNIKINVMYNVDLSQGKLINRSRDNQTDRRRVKPRKITSITRSIITVPNIEERESPSHLPINAAREISPTLGTTKFTPYPIINAPNAFFTETSFFTE